MSKIKKLSTFEFYVGNLKKMVTFGISTFDIENLKISKKWTPLSFQHHQFSRVQKSGSYRFWDFQHSGSVQNGVQMFTPHHFFNIWTWKKWVFSVLRIYFLPRKKRDFNTKISLSDFLNICFRIRASKSGIGNGPLIRLKVGPFNRKMSQIQRGLTGVSKRGSFGVLNMSTWACFGCWNGEKKLWL